ncbi:hypothetical protein WR25_19263 isoform B [Diploscapter pachys]|uniref:Uncharacterized protein n=1 Tax=Diploscapter pachys TaxID=2018661 RepID=A0A2A2L7Y3_9BILA|nr:hypothetical protein WR25_19263 isoform B [Diploscapter pachys]
MLGTTPRLLPCLRTARIAQLGRFRLASTQQVENKEVWKEINRLASAGKWDNLNNMPEMFIRGKDKQDAYAAFQKINTKTGVFEQSPGAAVFGFLFRPFCAAVFIYVIFSNFISN